MVSSVTAYLAFLALLGTERLLELLLSKRNSKLAFARGAIEVGRAHFRVMAVFHASFLVSCAAEVLALRRPFPGPLGWVALLGALVAQALRYWAIATLGSRWNVRIIVWPGAEPITSGPYQFVRHPNYLAIVLEMVCVPLIHGCWLTALLFSAGNVALLTVRIRNEERALGSTYATAFGDRPRFIPRIGRDA
jgi:methyltransferase